MRGRRPRPLDDSGAIDAAEASRARRWPADEAQPRATRATATTSGHPRGRRAVRYVRSSPARGCGGIGRRARFRSVWMQVRGGSSPLIRISSGFVKTHLGQDRKSTRLNSSHQIISYAVFCLKKKKKIKMNI